MSEEIIEFLNLKTAAEESPWDSHQHVYRVLTSPAYAHLDPRPRIRRLPGSNVNMLLRSEWEEFKARLAELAVRSPKKTKLMEERRQARLARERETEASD